MRELTMLEVGLVSGGSDTCSAEDSGNKYVGRTEPSSFGDEMISFYEGVVAVASHIIARVAEAL